MKIKTLLLISFAGVMALSCSSSNESDSTAAGSGPEAELTGTAKEIALIDEWAKSLEADTRNFNPTPIVRSRGKTKVRIVDYRERFRDNAGDYPRKMLVYEVNGIDSAYAEALNIDNVRSMTRSYFYRDGAVVLVREKISFDSRSEEAQNSYYFRENEIIACAKEGDIFEGTSVDQVTRDQFGAERSDPLQYWIKMTSFPSELTRPDRPSLVARFLEEIKLEYPGLDSLASAPTDDNTHHVAEVFYEEGEEKIAALYLLELQEKSTGWEGRPKMIGKCDGSIESVRTPGDFYYYLMTKQREGDRDALHQRISRKGFRYYNSASVVKENIVSRDSIDFENLVIQTNLYKVNFNFYLKIDSAFDKDGTASFSYSGGGFHDHLSLKKEGNRVFLEGFSSSSH